MLLLRRTELSKVVTMDATIASVEGAFASYQAGKTVSPLRMHIEAEEVSGVYLLMPSYIKEASFFGAKILSVYPENQEKQKPTISSVYILNRLEDGAFLAMMEGSFLTGMRTGAASAVAAKYLAREDAAVHGIVGAGGQALFQAEAMGAVRQIEKIVVCDLTLEAAEQFGEMAKEKMDVEVEVVVEPKEVAAQADILTTITTSAKPFLSFADLPSGCHVNAVGAFKPKMRELNEDILQQSRVVVDTYDGCLKEAGELIIPLASGVYNRADIHAELGEIVTGRKSGRQNSEEVTVFKSVGVAFEDLVTAQLAFAEATKQKIGQKIVFTD